MSDLFPIRTERLIIRPFSPDDLNDVHDLQSRPDVVRYLPYGVRDREEVRKALNGKVRQGIWPPEEDDALCVAVVLPETGKVIGEVVLFHRSVQHRLGEIGYVFHPDYGGRGYATEAARAVLRIGFDDFGLYRIIARLDARNTPSASVAERLGMRREAHFVRNEIWKGEWTDELVYAILDTEWKNGSLPHPSKP